jgi:branched-chain amino acid transport system ATP-binding protein
LRAVADVSFVVGPKQIVALIGPNGAGKTTTFNAILGAIAPTQGSIRFKGTDTTGFPPYRMAEVGMVRTFQNVRLFGDLSLRENFIMGGYVSAKCGLVTSMLRSPRHTRSEREAGERADRWLARLDLLGYADAKATSLPLGLQRVAEIGRALMSMPSLILLDEPAAGLNPAEKEKLGGLLKEIAAELDGSLLLVDHDMKLVMGVADRIVVLDFGIKIAEGTPSEIARNPAVVEAYMGV